MKLRPVVVLALLLSLACGGGGGGADPRPDGPPRYVLAASGLKLRSEPSKDGAELQSVPFGAEVVLAPDQGPTQTISGMREAWQKVWFEGQLGWAFGGYLGPFRPPTECADLGTTVRTLWGVDGEPTLLLQRGDPQNRYEQWSANLMGGARLEWVEDPDGGSDELLVPGVSLNQAWNTLRRCIPEPEAARSWTTPAASKSCGAGCTVTVTDTTIQVDHAEGRGCTTRLESVGDGVRVAIACGLDFLAPTGTVR